jgi:hypothetical protein
MGKKIVFPDPVWVDTEELLMAEVCPVTIEAQTSKVNSMTRVFFIVKFLSLADSSSVPSHL